MDRLDGPGSLRPAAGRQNGADFTPHPLLRGGRAQTIAANFLPRNFALPPSERRLFQVEAIAPILPDGNGDAPSRQVQVMCKCNWQPRRDQAVTLLLVHGLEGSSESQYMIGTAGKAWAAGMNVVRMNIRNCGGTEALGPTLYHSGMSDDIGHVVRELLAGNGAERIGRIALAGFSMGGNQVLKLAGEWGRDGAVPRQLVAVAAVSPAMDLAVSADALHLPRNRVFEWRFLFSLRQTLRRKQCLFPEQFQTSKQWWRSIRDFDDCVTAPNCGFRDAADYYEQASASRVAEFITLPTLVVHSLDDPFIRITPPTQTKLAANPRVRFVLTEHGGHCAFLAADRHPNGDRRWVEHQIVDFVRGVNGC
jgi:uncharacterized protein